MSMHPESPFCGSYAPDDCQFLLKPMRMPNLTVSEKEALIQSGARHYSELLTPERLPAPRYVDLFLQLTDRYAARMASDVVTLAQHIADAHCGPLTIASLARAGTPVGALLTRALRQCFHRDVRHYSLSIIRDRGIDENALRYILEVARRPAAGVVFVDGWTAKGVITRELQRSIANWNARHPELLLDGSLHVLCDIGGTAEVAASCDDYAIPSGILNATVSGLVSRSVLNDQLRDTDFHGCVFYPEFLAVDRSTWFLDQVSCGFARAKALPLPSPREKAARAEQTKRWISDCLASHKLSDINLIKPGVAEATRVLLRRLPEQLIVRDPEDTDVHHLLTLARIGKVRVTQDATMPFRAVSLIRSLRGDPAVSAARSAE